jgi:hypothetical protein
MSEGLTAPYLQRIVGSGIGSKRYHTCSDRLPEAVVRYVMKSQKPSLLSIDTLILAVAGIWFISVVLNLMV